MLSKQTPDAALKVCVDLGFTKPISTTDTCEFGLHVCSRWCMGQFKHMPPNKR